MLVVFAAGVACGLAWNSLTTSERNAPDYTIRSGRAKYTNPLLECEIAEYRPGQELRPFKKELRELVELLQKRGDAAHVSLYFRDLDNGPWIGIDANRTYTPASLLKVPIVMAAMKQAETDPAFIRREVLFRGLAGDPYLARYQSEDPLVDGRTYSMEYLASRAAALSDNYAAALLGQNIDPGVLRRLLFDLGLPAELADNPKMPATLSPRVYGQLFRVLYNATYLSHETSERTLGYFARSSFRDGLEAGVPPGTIVAHKFGTSALDEDAENPAQLHDCGIVYAPSRTYFLCVMTEGDDHAKLAGVIAEISRFVYLQIESQPKTPLSGATNFP